MTARLAMIQQLAFQFGDMVAGWSGPLVVRTVHLGDIGVPAEDDLAITEMGVMINWMGSEPGGQFFPWAEVTVIEQADITEVKNAGKA